MVEQTDPCDPMDQACVEQTIISYEEVAMPIILWLFGFPVTLALVMWLAEIVRF